MSDVNEEATPVRTLCTIGYERSTVAAFLTALEAAGVRLLVDVRAVASSRRPGFSKTKLAGNVAGVGIDYLHLRGLGTPADGRAAARGGRHAEMRRIFGEHLQTAAAQDDLRTLIDIVAGDRTVCLLCFEADSAHCHRTLVAEAVAAVLPIRIQHLAAAEPEPDADDDVD
jgi:uncharacterized protein (DUF488 family)